MALAFVGKVKSFNPEKGWGHIECEDTHQIYGKDIFLLRSQLDGSHTIAKGTQVSFGVVDKGRGPEAIDVQIASAGPKAITPTPTVPKGLAATGAGSTQAFVGSIKSFNPVSGWGHIQCEQTEEIYGKDIFFLKSKLPKGTIEKGTMVQFAVTQGLKGPEALYVHPLSGGGAATLQLVQPRQFISQVLPGWQPPTAGKAFYGTVKSFNDEKGWGHISCPQTQAIYGKDMFVMRSALNGALIKTGDQVQFAVQMGIKGPEATNVKVLGPPDEIYNGVIKQFNEEKGWGFIDCPETREVHGKDIFLHRNELDGYVPTAGEAVQFVVHITVEGRPEATSLSFGTPGAYGAYQKTTARRGKARALPY